MVGKLLVLDLKKLSYRVTASIHATLVDTDSLNRLPVQNVNIKVHD